jgi:hypothetical protein
MSGEITFIDSLWDDLDRSFAPYADKRFKRFIQQRRVSKWVIAADFCIDDPHRPKNSFAFVVFPAGDQLAQTMSMLERIPKRDLKHVRLAPSNKLLRALRKGKVFSFCFVVDPKCRLFVDAKAARSSIDRTIEMMEHWQNASECTETIEHVRAMRVEANKSSVSLKLLTNIVLCTALASYIAGLLCKHWDVELIAWAPDRDKISEAYNCVASTLFTSNISALSERVGFKYPQIGIFVQDNSDLWYDSYVRIADFVAGAAAAWDPPLHDLVPPKIATVWRTFADNPYLIIFRLNFSPDGQRTAISMARLAVSRRRFPQQTHD